MTVCRAMKPVASPGLTLHEIVRLLFSFFNELQLQGI